MLNRLRFIQLVHAQHFVETSHGHLKVDFSKDWYGIIGENAGINGQTRQFSGNPDNPGPIKAR
ncbi:hypothetical protein THH46_29710 [Pseudomonas sp. NA13]